MRKQIRINNQIRAPQVRVIDEKGINMGVFGIEEALSLAKERETDLIEITANANPPVCKLMDYGKYLYIESKKEKNAKPVHQSSVREIRFGLGTSAHDLEVKAKKISDFLVEGDKVKIGMLLRGREKYLDKNFLEERLRRILNFITAEYKIADSVKRGPRGLLMVVEKV